MGQSDEERRAYQREYYRKNREHIKKKAAERYVKKAEYQAAYAKRYRYELKAQVFGAYGRRCNCCGETNVGFLTVDHVNGGGNEHRKSVGGGVQVYLDIIRRNFPEDFQVLCYNCNLGRQWNGGTCPHVTSISVSTAVSM